jgi:hypothetical protein
MKLTRRLFLSIVAAALVVRPSAAPAKAVTFPPSVAGPVPSPTGMWQDMARQIPALKTGDPVAYVTGRFMSDGVDTPMIQPDPDRRPTLGKLWQDKHYIEFNGPNQQLEKGSMPTPYLPPHLAFKAGMGTKVFEVRVSSDASAQALATTEQEMMKRWIK